MGNSAKRDAREAETQQKRLQALELRKRGYGYQQIAQALGLRAKSTAHDLVHDAIADIPREAAEDVRELELQRLDRWLAALDKRAMKGEARAVLAGVRILERRAKLLGLDAPEEVNIKGSINHAPMIMIPPERSNGVDSHGEGAAPEGLEAEPRTAN